jgi:hypothetical protein
LFALTVIFGRTICFTREILGRFLGCSDHLTHQLPLFSTNEQLEARLSLNRLAILLSIVSYTPEPYHRLS